MKHRPGRQMSLKQLRLCLRAHHDYMGHRDQMKESRLFVPPFLFKSPLHTQRSYLDFL